MLRKNDDCTIEFKCIREGKGEVEMHRIAENADELMGKGRLFNRMVIAPGNSIGTHMHEGDNELFYFLSGTGEYYDDGETVAVGPGDVAICRNGQTHGLVNTGEELLEFIALILYS